MYRHENNSESQLLCGISWTLVCLAGTGLAIYGLLPQKPHAPGRSTGSTDDTIDDLISKSPYKGPWKYLAEDLEECRNAGSGFDLWRLGSFYNSLTETQRADLSDHLKEACTPELVEEVQATIDCGGDLGSFGEAGSLMSRVVTQTTAHFEGSGSFFGSGSGSEQAQTYNYPHVAGDSTQEEAENGSGTHVAGDSTQEATEAENGSGSDQNGSRSGSGTGEDRSYNYGTAHNYFYKSGSGCDKGMSDGNEEETPTLLQIAKDWETKQEAKAAQNSSSGRGCMIM